MTLLDLDPNVVKPGWTPLLILIGLALVMALLFRSMRRQFRKVDANYPRTTPTGVAAGTVDDVASDRPRPGPADTAAPRGGGPSPHS